MVEQHLQEAVAQYRAAARRSFWPAVVGAPLFLVGAALTQWNQALGLSVAFLGLGAAFVIVIFNVRAQYRAWKRLRDEGRQA